MTSVELDQFLEQDSRRRVVVALSGVADDVVEVTLAKGRGGISCHHEEADPTNNHHSVEQHKSSDSNPGYKLKRRTENTLLTCFGRWQQHSDEEGKRMGKGKNR